jgi:D-glycerate 3-kinase
MHLSISKTDIEQQLLQFCQDQQLPIDYIDTAKLYFLPLCEKLEFIAKQRTPLFVGVNGCQGSGKSTLALLLEKLLSDNSGLRVANLSIDDFYLTKSEREQLALKIHPLFRTRGVPGTHDITLLQQTLDKLSVNSGPAAIPRFNKAADDRLPPDMWQSIETPVDIILLEGWCVGVTHQEQEELQHAINKLEAEEDNKVTWRNTINKHIKQQYVPLFEQLDLLIMLKAPSFNCVYQWRAKQEDKLRNKTNNNLPNNIMNKDELERFIHHYQRLTEHMLKHLPRQADIVFDLNSNHQIDKCISNV